MCIFTISLIVFLSFKGKKICVDMKITTKSDVRNP